MSNSPRLLVTGVSGFLGAFIAAHATARQYEVHGLDLMPRPPHLQALHKYYQVEPGREGFHNIIALIKPDICIHCAGRASVAESLSDPREDFHAGPVLTFCILDALRERRPQCRFVLLSSAAVYGNPRRLPVTEEEPPCPISPYGFHKLQCEMLCREFQTIYGMHTAAVRIFSAYGQGLRRQVLWDICRKLLTGEALQLRGTGNETRDFIHGSDVARGVLNVAESASSSGEIYNLAGGGETRVRELALLAAAALECRTEPQFDGAVPPGDPLRWKADIQKIEGLGFQPYVGLENGVREYALWCKQQPLH